MSLEQILEETPVKGVINISSGNFVALLFKPTGSFTGLEIYASDNEVKTQKTERIDTAVFTFWEQY